jgi:dTDP-4-amino-4,6-dideoxygalactose transaminase
MIRFNQPYLFGPELEYVRRAIDAGRIAGNGEYTKMCHRFFEDRFGLGKCLLTTSCTDALEMASILADIQPGDEVIVPSYTFVSSANAFVLRGARIVFADSRPDHPNIDESKLRSLITDRTKAIVVVHYGGAACEMNAIMEIANELGVLVIEDAAQAIDAFYKGTPLGSIGHMAAFSFHETKNVVSGEGGMLVINDDRFKNRAEIIWEKGTNRTAFYRGEVDKYGWVDVGSSFLPSDLIAAYLVGQLENLEKITRRRLELWNMYHLEFADLETKGRVKRPRLPKYGSNNGHVYYLQCESLSQRSALIDHLKRHEIGAVFHYLSLHRSPFYHDKHDERELPNADRFANTIVRLPLHLHLSNVDLFNVVRVTLDFFKT